MARPSRSGLSVTASSSRLVNCDASAGRARSSVGQYLLLAYLPTEHAVAGAGLQVLYMNECFPVTVAADAAVFDPENTRMNA